VYTGSDCPHPSDAIDLQRSSALPVSHFDSKRKATLDYGCPNGLHDDFADRLGKSGQRGLDQPRFERHSCGRAAEIEFPGYSQRFKR
jgi:hypothetical protein